MNKDQASGAIKEVGGKAQEKIGKLVGSKSQEVKGIKRQIEGKLQESFGDLKESLKDANRDR